MREPSKKNAGLPHPPGPGGSPGDEPRALGEAYLMAKPRALRAIVGTSLRGLCGQWAPGPNAFCQGEDWPSC